MASCGRSSSLHPPNRQPRHRHSPLSDSWSPSFSLQPRAPNRQFTRLLNKGEVRLEVRRSKGSPRQPSSSKAIRAPLSRFFFQTGGGERNETFPWLRLPLPLESAEGIRALLSRALGGCNTTRMLAGVRVPRKAGYRGRGSNPTPRSC